MLLAKRKHSEVEEAFEDETTRATALVVFDALKDGTPLRLTDLTKRLKDAKGASASDVLIYPDGSVRVNFLPLEHIRDYLRPDVRLFDLDEETHGLKATLFLTSITDKSTCIDDPIDAYLDLMRLDFECAFNIDIDGRTVATGELNGEAQFKQCDDVSMLDCISVTYRSETDDKDVDEKARAALNVWLSKDAQETIDFKNA